MGKKKILGTFFVTISILMAFSNLTLVGAVIGSPASNHLNWITIVLFVAGITLLIEKQGGLEKNLAQQLMESRAVITNPRKLKRIARRAGYEGRNVREGYQVLDKYGKPLTIIPHGHISKWVSRDIIGALATGESNFRQREDYSSS